MDKILKADLPSILTLRTLTMILCCCRKDKSEDVGEEEEEEKQPFMGKRDQAQDPNRHGMWFGIGRRSE